MCERKIEYNYHYTSVSNSEIHATANIHLFCFAFKKYAYICLLLLSFTLVFYTKFILWVAFTSNLDNKLLLTHLSGMLVMHTDCIELGSLTSPNTVIIGTVFQICFSLYFKHFLCGSSGSTRAFLRYQATLLFILDVLSNGEQLPAKFPL